jgi:putative N6-adenine-specific DNA methylase
VSFATGNARAAGIGHLLRFEVKDVRDFRPPTEAPGVIVCNPPYGERIGEEKELKPLYRALGEVLYQRCAGWRAFVFTGNARLAREIGMKPARRVPLMNGKIPCELLEFDLS